MAKKITISELVVKISLDSKAAIKQLRDYEKKVTDTFKREEQQQQKKLKGIRDQIKEDATLKKMRTANRREAIKYERELTRATYRGEVMRKKHIEATGKAKLAAIEKERRALERVSKASERGKKARTQERIANQNRRKYQRSNYNSGASISNIAIGSALGQGITSSIVAAVSAAMNLFTSAKNTAISREQYLAQTYGRYRSKGLSQEQAQRETVLDTQRVSELNQATGFGFDTTGRAFKAASNSGASREESTKVVKAILSELKTMGASAEAAQAFIREVSPWLSGGDIDAASANTIEDWGLNNVLSSMLGKSEKELSQLRKGGKLNETTGAINLQGILKNLEKFGTGQYVKENPSLNPVMKAQQELDSAMMRLKEVFSLHASGGISAALNSVADSLSNPATQDTIKSAGENFGKLLVTLSGSLNEFVKEDGLKKVSDIFSSQNIDELSTHVGTFIKLVEGMSTAFGWIVSLGETLGETAAKIVLGFKGEDPLQKELAKKVGNGETTSTGSPVLEQQSSTGYQGRGMEALKGLGKGKAEKGSPNTLQNPPSFSGVKLNLSNNLQPTKMDAATELANNVSTSHSITNHYNDNRVQTQTNSSTDAARESVRGNKFFGDYSFIFTGTA